MRMPRRLAMLALAAALLAMALTVSAARLDLDDEDDSGVLDELLAVDEEAERGGLDAGDSGGAEAVRRAQSMVLVLDNDNARRAVEDHGELLLLGYAPWCERSAQLMPRFAEAAAALRAMGSSVAFAKLDGERYPKAASAVGVKGFPTVILFVNGTEHVYTGLHTKDAIVTWVRKKTGAPVIRLQSKDSAEEFLKKDQTFVIGLFKNFEGAEYEEFLKAAITDNEVQFVETNDRSVAKILFPGVTSEERFLGLVKSEPEKFEKFGEAFEEKAILKFVELHKFPLITVFTELNSAKVYSSPIKMQVFTFSETYDFEDLESMIEEVARAFKTKVTAFDTTNGAKYLVEGDINAKNLREFCLGLLDGTLRPFQKSEPIPQEIKLSKKSSVKAMAKLIKERLQISDVETVAAADGVKDEL
ncbi:hypothetical protein PR202_ga18038 [Eleusine coracana subsp. coracana]|uniref:protein disulfide-isomerase n=1 Tax=Eleusine coracana subsp. coracana TaxID=191504 RepID=A0AAV5CRF4_ELECO|nr:hypothetical protein PR202_ga18038 [Eleusine coracana subsp. coracana]